MLKEGMYERLLNKRSYEMVYPDMDYISSLIQKAYEKESIRIKILKIHGFDIERHRELDNTHNAIKSSGCGCMLCKARHMLAMAKYEKRIAKLLFGSDGPIGDKWWEKLELRHAKYYEIHKEFQRLEEYFDNIELKKLDSNIKDARLRYNSAADTINHIFSSEDLTHYCRS